MKKQNLLINIFCLVFLLLIGCQNKQTLPSQVSQTLKESSAVSHNIDDSTVASEQDEPVTSRPLTIVDEGEVGCRLDPIVYGRWMVLANKVYAWSPTWDRVAFITEEGEIYLVDVSSQEHSMTQITDLRGMARLAWAPDGIQLATLVREGDNNIYIYIFSFRQVGIDKKPWIITQSNEH